MDWLIISNKLNHREQKKTTTINRKERHPRWLSIDIDIIFWVDYLNFEYYYVIIISIFILTLKSLKNRRSFLKLSKTIISFQLRYFSCKMKHIWHIFFINKTISWHHLYFEYLKIYHFELCDENDFIDQGKIKMNSIVEFF